MTCTYRNSYLESDEFFTLILHILSVIQFPLHLYGAYVIIAKTPSVMKNVKLPMLMLHLVCASFDLIVTIGIVPVVQFPILAGYPLGFLYTLGVPSYVQSYIAVTFLLMLAPSVAMFFESRYNFIVRKDSETESRKIKRAVHHFVNYLLTILVFAPTVFDMPSVSETRRIFMEKLPCLPTEILDRPGYTMLGNLSIVRIKISVDIAFCFIQVIAFFYPTWSHISSTKSLSRRTTQLQRSFFKALLLQVMVPFIIVLIPGCYIISTFFTYNFDILLCNMVMVAMTLHGFLSTIIMLTIHKPYRTATKELLRIGRQKPSLPVRKVLSIN
ncbi:hypothetical protein B9Z55_020936 [Caenorhabditis nigoni]|uniref:Serpentine Receptor, class H n=2 Tax=Caenorhabditis nigoni TaxID=1611254 RepID=A0A2G5TPT2_9PELO|nr:hypothetical protein B9Z55_020936 [Caenorhabditis nigoni]